MNVLAKMTIYIYWIGKICLTISIPLMGDRWSPESVKMKIISKLFRDNIYFFSDFHTVIYMCLQMINK